jgi:hypothetical protein
LHIDHLESREKLFDVIQEERNKQALLSIDCLAPDQSNRAIPHAKRGGITMAEAAGYPRFILLSLQLCLAPSSRSPDHSPYD